LKPLFFIQATDLDCNKFVFGDLFFLRSCSN